MLSFIIIIILIAPRDTQALTMVEKGNSFLKAIIKTGLDYYFPKVALLIVNIKNKDGLVIFEENYDSIDHKHTEEKMLKDSNFVKNVKSGGVDITLTSNYSPCSECAAKLIEFYKAERRFIQNFTIQFSLLFRIEDEGTKEGLKKLSNEGIALEAMTEKSWFDVVMRFMFGLEPDKVRRRDEATREGLAKVLSESLVEDLEVEETGKRLDGMQLSEDPAASQTRLGSKSKKGSSSKKS